LIPINSSATMAIDGLSTLVDALPPSFALYKPSLKPYAPLSHLLTPAPLHRARAAAWSSCRRAIAGRPKLVAGDVPFHLSLFLLLRARISSSPLYLRTAARPSRARLLPWSAARSSLRRHDLPLCCFSDAVSFLELCRVVSLAPLLIFPLRLGP
jgi:hypothetical protein